MYDVIVERSAEKDLKKLSSEVRPRAEDKVSVPLLWFDLLACKP